MASRSAQGSTREQIRSIKLRALADRHALELAGWSTILLPTTAPGREALRRAWLEVEPEARAGTLTSGPLGLEILNFGVGDGRADRPACWYWWSEPTTDAERKLMAAYDASERGPGRGPRRSSGLAMSTSCAPWSIRRASP